MNQTIDQTEMSFVVGPGLLAETVEMPFGLRSMFVQKQMSMKWRVDRIMMWFQSDRMQMCLYYQFDRTLIGRLVCQRLKSDRESAYSNWNRIMMGPVRRFARMVMWSIDRTTMVSVDLKGSS